jgi:peptide/nickel transport system substrate-binding protein
MLATSWSWSGDYKTLTFNIRQGVKFSNGDPMTAADVAYTFSLIKKNPALDLTGAWSVLTSVTASGADKVTMTFNQPAATWFYYVASQVPIVPEAVWSKIANPVAYADPSPVGTGPYVVNPCRASNIIYTANPHYWQAGLPKIKKINYPAFTSNNTANEELATGQAQWGAQYIPGISSFYTAKSSSYHYWFPPTVNVSLVPNLTNSLLGDVKVRQAMSYAIDRSKVSSIGETGYEPPANQTGIVTPTFSAELDKTMLAKYGNYAYSPAKAKQVLASDGYTLKNGVMTSAKGQQLSFSVINIGGYSDWVASMQVVQQDLAAVGIKITPDNLSDTDFDSDLYNGKYQLAYYDQQTFGPSPYYELNNWLNSADTAPVGKTAATNYERYSSPATDKLLQQYSGTTDKATQQSILDQLQGVMLSDVPVIPVVEAVDWYQYDSAAFTGWPTAGNPYALPSAYAYPDAEQVLLHLTPAK